MHPALTDRAEAQALAGGQGLLLFIAGVGRAFEDHDMTRLFEQWLGFGENIGRRRHRPRDNQLAGALEHRVADGLGPAQVVGGDPSGAKSLGQGPGGSEEFDFLLPRIDQAPGHGGVPQGQGQAGITTAGTEIGTRRTLGEMLQPGIPDQRQAVEDVLLQVLAGGNEFGQIQPTVHPDEMAVQGFEGVPLEPGMGNAQGIAAGGEPGPVLLGEGERRVVGRQDRTEGSIGRVGRITLGHARRLRRARA